MENLASWSGAGGSKIHCYLFLWWYKNSAFNTGI